MWYFNPYFKIFIAKIIVASCDKSSIFEVTIFLTLNCLTSVTRIWWHHRIPPVESISMLAILGFDVCFLTLFVIHTLQLNVLFSDWLFSKHAQCIENVHCTPRTAPRLRSDCARCFWCVIARANVTSTDPFFSLGKVVNILHV